MNTDKSLSLGIWVSQLRKALDLRQRDLAKCVGCSPSTIKKIEEGDRRPSRQVAELLAECLDIPPDERDAFVQFARAETDSPPPSPYQRAANPSVIIHTDDHTPWHTLHYPHPSHLRHPSNLPAPPNIFIGRKKEVLAATALLQRPGVRLLTLTGPPGTGKTRLSLQVAAEMLTQFDDGVFFVALASVTSRRLVASAIAQALDVRESARQPLIDSLKNYLRDKHVLFLLDNFEQATPAAPLVSELMAAAQGLKVLVTSRALLHIYGEFEMKIPPLSLPHRKYPPLVERLMGLESVQLFVERAQAARPGFNLTAENAPAVAEICRRLDGLPLAIELAAARIRFYSPQLMLKRLEGKDSDDERWTMDDNNQSSNEDGNPSYIVHRSSSDADGSGGALKLLVGGPHDLPARQRTLRGAIAWSYDLLNLEEQKLFRRISVFVSGFTSEAAEAVCGGGIGDQGSGVRDRGSGISNSVELIPDPRSLTPLESDVLDGLLSLINKSLLRTEPLVMNISEGEPAHEDGTEREMRFSMLETIREYGLEKLAEDDETEATRRQHALYYLRLAEKAEPEIRGAEQKLWLDRLDIEHDNLRAALQWACEAGEAEIGLRTAAALGWFWFRRGYLSEGRDWLTQTLRILDFGLRNAEYQGKKPKPRTRSPKLALEQQKHAHNEEESKIQNPKSKIQRALAKALSAAARLAEHQGDHSTSRALYEESLHAYRELDDNEGVGYALRGLGFMFFREGNMGKATELFEQSLSLFRELQEGRGTATALRCLGDVALREGNYGLARLLFMESLELFQVLNDKYIIAILLTSLGNVALDQGDYADARSLYDRGLAIFRELADRYGIAGSLGALAEVARCQMDYDAACVLNEESLSIWKVVGEKWNMAMTQHNMGHAVYHLGELERARAAFVESLNLFRETGANVGIAMCLAGLGGVAAAQGHGERAAHLFGSADALLEASGTVLQAADLSDYERNVANARTQLGETMFNAAWSVGRTTPVHDAIANALA